MVSPRMMDLLEKAAIAFETQQNPFSMEWLTQNNVTVEECLDLSELIGKILIEHWMSQREEENK